MKDPANGTDLYAAEHAEVRAEEGYFLDGGTAYFAYSRNANGKSVTRVQAGPAFRRAERPTAIAVAIENEAQECLAAGRRVFG